MVAFLKIENPGAAPVEAFTLMGASTSRDADNAIGKFGTGNKHGVVTCLRHGLSPVIYPGNDRLEFSVRPHEVDTGLGKKTFNHVQYTHGSSKGKDLGWVVELGADDWATVDLALREFVSNALDRALAEDENQFWQGYAQQKGFTGELNYDEREEWNEALKNYRVSCPKFWEKVLVEVVNENQVRAKRGTTRVFVPLNDKVLDFYNNLGKWFLHFSEPELLNKVILPKGGRNLGDRRAAVVYRRGVRVREFESSEVPSLFDYNLENLKLDESRRVDDWYVRMEAARAIARADQETLQTVFQAFLEDKKVWELGFDSYGLNYIAHDPKLKEAQEKAWKGAFEAVAGTDAVISTADGGSQAARKGYRVVKTSEAFVEVAGKLGIMTPDKVLSDDDKHGRQIFDSTPDADAAVDFCWGLIVKYGMTNGRERPLVKTFRKVMEGESQTLGFYRDKTVFINQDIAGNGSLTLGWHGITQQLFVTAAEECLHHSTGATDNSRDFQDAILNLMIYAAKEAHGLV